MLLDDRVADLAEDTIRELVLKPSGIALGEPLVDFRGVLTGMPVYGGRRELLERGPSSEPS